MVRLSETQIDCCFQQHSDGLCCRLPQDASGQKQRATHPNPPEPVRLTVEQSYTEVDELAWLGAVYDQDTSNLQLQQEGLKATRKGITLGNYQEARIRRFHLTLDEYLSST